MSQGKRVCHTEKEGGSHRERGWVTQGKRVGHTGKEGAWVTMHNTYKLVISTVEVKTRKYNNKTVNFTAL